jgi:hypothetical protein
MCPLGIGRAIVPGDMLGGYIMAGAGAIAEAGATMLFGGGYGEYSGREAGMDGDGKP